jgi:hypothetical protein
VAVAFSEVTHRVLEARPFRLGAADLVGEDLLAAGLLESILLGIEVLLAGRNPSVSVVHRGRSAFHSGIQGGASPAFSALNSPGKKRELF